MLLVFACLLWFLILCFCVFVVAIVDVCMCVLLVLSLCFVVAVLLCFIVYFIFLSSKNPSVAFHFKTWSCHGLCVSLYVCWYRCFKRSCFLVFTTMPRSYLSTSSFVEFFLFPWCLFGRGVWILDGDISFRDENFNVSSSRLYFLDIGFLICSHMLQ